MAEWLRRLTRKPKVRTAIGSNPALDSLVAARNSSPGRPVPCEGNLVATAGSCGRLMVRHPWPLLEISLSDYRRLATLNINTNTNTSYYPKRSITCTNLELLLETQPGSVSYIFPTLCLISASCFLYTCRGVTRAKKVGGIYENFLATPSTSAPYLFSLRFYGNLEHHLTKVGGGNCPHTTVATPLHTCFIK